ncbi:MAG: RNA polymerase sigma-70 factor [Bacteroidota bacterium]|nr:RNA polymerase sigma-70 factor [Bacteroidota bacterium]
MDNTVFSSLPDKGDREAFDALFKQFYPRLTAYACLFLDDGVAEDVVQDLFLYLWEKSDYIDIRFSLEAYLFKAVYLRCLNQLKQIKTRDSHHKLIGIHLQQLEKQLFDPETNESIRKLYMKELEADINAAIDSLPEKCREVFKLSYLFDLKNKEISEVMDISISTVENHVYNALKVLRKKLSKHAHLFSIIFPL